MKALLLLFFFFSLSPWEKSQVWRLAFGVHALNANEAKQYHHTCLLRSRIESNRGVCAPCEVELEGDRRGE